VGALNPLGVRPTTNKNPNQFSEIVKHNSKQQDVDVSGFKNKLVVDPTPILVTIGSGACDAVCPPGSFPHTNIDIDHREYGKCYGACGEKQYAM
jgi:hypothetical protein